MRDQWRMEAAEIKNDIGRMHANERAGDRNHYTRFYELDQPIRLRAPAIKKQSEAIKRQRPAVNGETIDLEEIPIKTKRENRKVKKQEADENVVIEL
jgi:hypothetical protein